MNDICEVVVTAITPNGSAALPFVIPSVAEGSAVSPSQYRMLMEESFCSLGAKPRNLQFPLPSIECYGEIVLFIRSVAKWRDLLFLSLPQVLTHI